MSDDLLDALAVAVVHLDTDGAIVDANAPARALLGIELAGRRLDDLEPEAGALRHVRDALTNGARLTRSVGRVRLPGGQAASVDVAFVPDGRGGGAVALTDPRVERASERLHARQVQLAQLAAALQSLRLDVGEGEVLDAIAHAARRCLGFEHVVVNLLDADAKVLRVAAHASPDAAARATLAGATYPLEDFEKLLAPQFRVGNAWFVPHEGFDWSEVSGPVVLSMPEGRAPPPPVGDELTPWHREDALFAPIQRAGGEMVGILSVDGPRDGLRPTLDTIRVIEIFVEHAAGLIENARLYATVQQELAERVRAEEALQVARDHALAASQSKSAFLTSVSHELRTPLNAILGYAELAAEEVAGTALDVGPDLERIQDAGHHLLDLINDLLDLARVESGKIEVVLESVDVQGLVDEVVVLLAAQARQNGDRLVARCAAGLRVHADRMRLRQVLINLVGNAIKFTDGGEVRIEAEARGDRVAITVVDTGIGITPPQLTRLFEPFVQAEADTARRYGGSGLGLPISLGLCRAMGGDLVAESQPDVGSRFTVLLANPER